MGRIQRIEPRWPTGLDSVLHCPMPAGRREPVPACPVRAMHGFHGKRWRSSAQLHVGTAGQYPTRLPAHAHLRERTGDCVQSVPAPFVVQPALPNRMTIDKHNVRRRAQFVKNFFNVILNSRKPSQSKDIRTTMIEIWSNEIGPALPRIRNPYPRIVSVLQSDAPHHFPGRVSAST